MSTNRPQRPNLDGAELGFFDVLVALHVRYIRHRGEAFRLAGEHGMSDERILEIAKLSLVYACPENLRRSMHKVVAVVDAMPDPFVGSKPS